MRIVLLVGERAGLPPTNSLAQFVVEPLVVRAGRLQADLRHLRNRFHVQRFPLVVMGRRPKLKGPVGHTDEPSRMLPQVDETMRTLGHGYLQRVVEEAGTRQKPSKCPGDPLGATDLPRRDREAAGTGQRVPRVVSDRVE